MQTCTRSWYVLIHNSACYQSLTERIEALKDVEVYSPCRVVLRKRTDRPSSIERKLQLFPGYLLLRFDPAVTHTTTITALSGAHGFIRFSDEVCVVPEAVVDALQNKLRITPDRWLDCIECENLPSDLARTLHMIVDLPSDVARKAAFFAFLQQAAVLERLAARPGAQIYSTLRPRHPR